MKKTLRLLLFEECDRSCSGCCNKDWDLNTLPVCEDFTGYDEIILTGGEPMLYPERILKVVDLIRSVTEVPIFVYTAKCDHPITFLNILSVVDGVTLTLHNKEDVLSFLSLMWEMRNTTRWNVLSKSLRLNIFKEVEFNFKADFHPWVIKNGIQWIKDCPLPSNEVFMRLI